MLDRFIFLPLAFVPDIRWQRLLAFLVLLAWGVPLASCGPAKPVPETVKIGLVAPFEGPGYEEGYKILFAVKLALGEWNAKGGPGGYQVELIAYDEREEGLEARKLALDPQIVGVLGHLNSDSLLVGAFDYQEAGLAVIPFGTLPEETKERAYKGIFPFSPSESTLGRATALFFKELGKKRPAAIGGPTRHDRKVMEGFLEEAAANEMNVVLNVSLPEEGRYEEVLDSFRLARPDIVFFVGSPNMATALWKEVHKRGTPFLFSSQRDPSDFLSMAGTLAQGVYYISTSPPLPHPPPWAEFEGSYGAKWGVRPSPWAGLAYDGANILMEAIKVSVAEEGRPSRAGVLRALEVMKEYPGVSGTLTLNGETRKPRIYFYRLNGQSLPGDLEWEWSP